MPAVAVPREERIKRIRDTFIMLVWTAARQFSQELQVFGLTLPQFVALVSLVAHKRPCAMSDLTKITLQDPPTMTGIIDRLIKTELVKRTRSEVDRRVVLVQATPEGIELVRQIRNRMDDEVADYAVFADDELAEPDRLLEYFEQLLEYTFRMHLKRRHSLGDADLDAEIEKLRIFLRDPLFSATPEIT
jgi:DNA-binding MarR family transcriptional regulator